MHLRSWEIYGREKVRARCHSVENVKPNQMQRKKNPKMNKIKHKQVSWWLSCEENANPSFCHTWISRPENTDRNNTCELCMSLFLLLVLSFCSARSRNLWPRMITSGSTGREHRDSDTRTMRRLSPVLLQLFNMTRVTLWRCDFSGRNGRTPWNCMNNGESRVNMKPQSQNSRKRRKKNSHHVGRYRKEKNPHTHTCRMRLGAYCPFKKHVPFDTGQFPLE